MHIKNLRYAFMGYLIVSARGRSTDKFLNLAAGQGILLWHVVKSAGKVVFRVDMDSFFDLRHPARETGCRVYILERRGLPFAWEKIKRRRGLLLGFCLFVLILYALSSFILIVSVTGNDRLTDEYILRLAEQAGIRPGLRKSLLKIDDKAFQIQLMDPELAWVGLQVRGTKLIIEVAETRLARIETDAPADLVAAKDGLILNVVAIAGEPLVQAGDTVRRGQVLIRGLLPLRQPPADGGQGQQEHMLVRARGQVQARVWYEGYGEASIVEQLRVRTGRRVRIWTLYLDGQPAVRLGRSGVVYTDSDRYTTAVTILEGILRLRVELKTDIIYEVEKRNVELTEEQALETAADRARTLAMLQLPTGQSVENVIVEEINLNRPGFVGVRYVLETIENIAIEKEITGGD